MAKKKTQAQENEEAIAEELAIRDADELEQAQQEAGEANSPPGIDARTDEEMPDTEE